MCIILYTPICFDTFSYQVYSAGKTIHSNLVDSQFKPVQINTSCRLRGTNKNVEKIESSDCKTVVFSFGLLYKCELSSECMGEGGGGATIHAFVLLELFTSFASIHAARDSQVSP